MHAKRHAIKTVLTYINVFLLVDVHLITYFDKNPLMTYSFISGKNPDYQCYNFITNVRHTRPLLIQCTKNYHYWSKITFNNDLKFKTNNYINLIFFNNIYVILLHYKVDLIHL